MTDHNHSRSGKITEKVIEELAKREALAFTCPQCGMTSHHPEDVREQYCGNCHQFMGPQEAA